MLQPLPLNPLMARNGGLRFNRYKQFQFSIPLNYCRLQQHAARHSPGERQTAAGRVLNAIQYQAMLATTETMETIS
jgi:hypothetical protein